MASLARLFSRVAFVLAVISVATCSGETRAPWESRATPIIAGVLDTEHDGVGALVGGGGRCSGTVVATNWILTAAHCESVGVDGAQFLVGDDWAQPSLSCPVRSFRAHPLYSVAGEHDIALASVEGCEAVAATPINRDSAADRAGTAITWVGYGATSAGDFSNTLRYRADGVISEVWLTSYSHEFNGSGPCNGDSGGPALAGVAGVETIVGVIAGGGEDCQELGVDTRVSGYVDWIDDVVAGGAGAIDCALTGGDCNVGACWLADVDSSMCLPTDGLALGDACDPDPEGWRGALPCADGTLCAVVSSVPGDGHCQTLCEVDVDCPRGEACLLPYFADVADVGVCQPTCDLMGGSCPAGTACWLGPGDDFFCYPTNGLGEGEECDPGQRDAMPCADGLGCVGVSATVHCRPFCRDDADCTPQEDCSSPIFRGIDPAGLCGPCADEDEDGACADVDCDDNEPDAVPGAEERCADAIDNDCDGETDEGCAADGDADTDTDTDTDADADVDADTDADADADADADDDAGDDGGCGCRTAGRPRAGASLVLVALVGLVMRRHARR